VLVTNCDAYFADASRPARATSEPSAAGLARFVDGWDGERVRLLVVRDPDRPDFDGTWRYAGTALMPWRVVCELAPVPSGLYEVSWRHEAERGALDLAPSASTYVDCGTPADYLRANLHASHGRSVVGAGARVEGELIRSVVWPGGVVAEGERLVDAVRAGRDVTVHAGG
jgi:MurNAc alpha-1-phosphate uridylyltransferase